MEYVTVSKARNQIPRLAESPTSTVLTHNGEPVALLVPIHEYRSTQALLKLAAHPDRMTQVMSAHQRVQRGELDGFVELESETHGAATLRKDTL